MVRTLIFIIPMYPQVDIFFSICNICAVESKYTLSVFLESLYCLLLGHRDLWQLLELRKLLELWEDVGTGLVNEHWNHSENRFY